MHAKGPSKAASLIRPGAKLNGRVARVIVCSASTLGAGRVVWPLPDRKAFVSINGPHGPARQMSVRPFTYVCSEGSMAAMEVGLDGVQVCYTLDGKPVRDGSILEMYRHIGGWQRVTVRCPDRLSLEILKDGLAISYGHAGDFRWPSST